MDNQDKKSTSKTHNYGDSVRTETLPEGALFVSPDGILYQVVMAGSAGFRKAEPWPWLAYGGIDLNDKPSAVALVDGSLLARNYPVVTEGIPLPPMGRADFVDPDGSPSHYIFPNERLAKMAAQLDATLAVQSGLSARSEQERWILGDGKHTFRIYHYQNNIAGEKTDLSARFAEEGIEALPCNQGPSYWQYMPIWSEIEPEDVDVEVSPVTEEPGTSSVAEASTPSDAEDAHSEAPLESKLRRNAMILSIDIGYGYTKGVGPNDLHFSFPSVIGTAEDIRFATDLIRGGESRPVKYSHWRFFYGEQAVLQSRVQSAIFDRSRVHDDTYKMLFVAALVELSRLAPDINRLKVVTGLPVDFFGDRPKVIESFEGIYRITAEQQMELAVEAVVVAPQPFGSLFRELLNENGKIANSDVEKGRIGIIDIGTYTTDFVVSDELRYVQRLSGSVSIGWSKVVEQVQQALGDQHMLELTAYEVDQAIQKKEVRIRGQSISLAPLIDPAITDIQTAIIARARDLWGSGAHLDLILVSGGGGPHLYDSIRDLYPHAHLLTKAFWANAEGFYRFGQRPATFEQQK